MTVARTSDPNTGHGHVRRRPDGVKARCGGPGICTECSRELARMESVQRKEQAVAGASKSLAFRSPPPRPNKDHLGWLGTDATDAEARRHYSQVCDYWIAEAHWQEARADQLNAELSAFLKSAGNKAPGIETFVGRYDAKLDELANLPHGWDSYDGIPPRGDCLAKARQLAALLPEGHWDIVPMSNGGLQIEQHCGGLDIELMIEGARPELKANDQLYRLRPLCTCQGTAHESASSSGYTPNPTCPVHAENGNPQA